jgi:hypothetical protein
MAWPLSMAVTHWPCIPGYGGAFSGSLRQVCLFLLPNYPGRYIDAWEFHCFKAVPQTYIFGSSCAGTVSRKGNVPCRDVVKRLLSICLSAYGTHVNMRIYNWVRARLACRARTAVI